MAIKMLKNNASQNADYLRSLLGELKVMSYLGSHPNLVKLLGAMTAKIKAGEVYLVFEFCSKGNAHKFVRAQREHFVDISAGPAPSGRISMRIGARWVARFNNVKQKLNRIEYSSSVRLLQTCPAKTHYSDRQELADSTTLCMAGFV